MKGIDAIKPKLEALKAGETVFPCGRRLPGHPPDEPAKEVRMYCQKLGEGPYVLGGWSQTKYERLKRTQPSYTDQYELLDLERGLVNNR